MRLIYYWTLLTHWFQKIPLKLLLVLPFVLLIAIAVGVTGYLSFTSGQEAVANLAVQVIERTDKQVKSRLDQYLSTPHLINQLNLNAVKLGQLNIKDLDQVQHQFWEQIKLFDSVTVILYGDEQGNSIGYVRELGRYLLIIQKGSEGKKNTAYEVDNQGNLREIFLVRNLDSRQRPWYQVGKVAKKSAWTPIFPWVNYPAAGIATSTPIYDREGKLQAMLAIHLKLDNISTFLQDLKPAANGQIFIMERSGDLVATSTLEIPYSQSNKKLVRLAASDSKNSLTQETAKELKLKFKNLGEIKKPQKLIFSQQGEREFAEVQPYQDEYGLDWLVVTVLPESDFMAEINANYHKTIILCLGSLLGAIVVATMISTWISQPLRYLSVMSGAIASGNLHQKIPENLPIQELSQLAKSFNQMSDQLHQAFASLAVALEESEAKFSTLFGYSPDPMAIATLAEGRYLEVNQSFLEVSGYSRDEIIGKTSRELNFWINIQERDHYLQAMQTDGYIHNWEFNFRMKSGEIRTLLSSAEVIELNQKQCAMIIVKDITERKKIEASLRLSEATNRALIAAIPDLLLRLDRNGNYINLFIGNEFQIINPDRSRDGKNICDILPTDRANERMNYVEKALQTGKLQTYEQQLEVEGKIQYEETRITPLNHNEVLVMVRDITERKQVELELAQAKRIAETSNRAKSEFLANMSHELRTPLNAILGFTQLMQGDRTLNAEQKENLDIIVASGEHLLSLINDVLEMSKIEAGRITFNKTNFELPAMLTSLQAMLQLKATEKGIKLHFDLAANLPQCIRTDKGKLRQIILNLLSNAIKFTHQGSVTLQVESQDKNTLKFTVLDTGSGIAKAELNHLFNPFIQTESGRRSHQGTGLGLVITRKFVQLMGGEIQVESTLGKGSIFRFTIRFRPVLTNAVYSSLSTRKIMALACKQTHYKIMIVDDIETNRQLLVKLLQPIGFEVREAKDGKEAIRLWQEWQPHLIWMDMRMPEVNGYAATKIIRNLSQTQDIPVIIIALTASVFEEQRAEIKAAGCDDMVRKPLQPQIIFDKLAEFLQVRYVYSNDEIKSSKPIHFPLIKTKTASDLKILIVEDNLVNQKIAVRILERFGYSADVVNNGKEAILSLQKQSYNLVFMDMQMPEMDGLEATRQICEHWPPAQRPVIIAMTASEEEKDRETCLQAGMNDFLSKPIRVEELREMLEKYL
ncbi:MAG: response regulator [Nostocales cyanobacterium]|nr:MAG: response regulator [Nostocales cyanobacterium]